MFVVPVRETVAILPLGIGNSFLREFTADGAEYLGGLVVQKWRPNNQGPMRLADRRRDDAVLGS